MKRKISLTALLLLGVLPFGAIAGGTEQPVSGRATTEKSAGEYIDDAAITAKVKAAFIQEEAVKATEINVDTFKGVVQLSGFATSPTDVNRAVQVASNVPGVKSVKNDIRLK